MVYEIDILPSHFVLLRITSTRYASPLPAGIFGTFPTLLDYKAMPPVAVNLSMNLFVKTIVRMNGFRSHLPYAWKTFYQGSGSGPIFYTILSMNCEQSISDHNYIPIIPCNTTGYSSSSSPTYSYAIVGEYVSVVDMPYSCTISTYMVIQPLKALPESINLSMSDLQDYLLLGLQLSFLPHFCSSQCKMKG
ncbi:hypothetical protein AAG906_012903 [Vitis piasezkii]